VASLSQGRTAAAQCGLFTYKSVPVIFEPPCMWSYTAGQGIICDRLLYKLQNYSSGSLFQSSQIRLAVHPLRVKPLQQLWDDTIN